MDAKQLGTFIAERRKELGMTQAVLAEKIHVTDKAVSKWERGAGLPDINSIETLAESLGVSLIELMQAKKIEEEHISKEEAEEVVLNTIQLSKTAHRIIHIFGGILLVIFLIISVFLLLVSLGMKDIPLNVISFILGLIAWGIPILHISFIRVKGSIVVLISSFGCALLSLICQFYEIARRVYLHDWSALLDTIDFLTGVAVFFSIVTLLLNVLMLFFSKRVKSQNVGG